MWIYIICNISGISIIVKNRKFLLCFDYFYLVFPLPFSLSIGFFPQLRNLFWNMYKVFFPICIQSEIEKTLSLLCQIICNMFCITTLHTSWNLVLEKCFWKHVRALLSDKLLQTCHVHVKHNLNYDPEGFITHRSS